MFEAVLRWVLLIGLIVVFIAYIIRALVRERRKTRRILKEWESPVKEPPLKEYRVTVLEKQCYTEESGTKFPKHHRRFGVKVRTDCGETVWYAVEEPIYHTIPDGAVGTLAVVGDRVYGFCEDE